MYILELMIIWSYVAAFSYTVARYMKAKEPTHESTIKTGAIIFAVINCFIFWAVGYVPQTTMNIVGLYAACSLIIQGWNYFGKKPITNKHLLTLAKPESFINVMAIAYVTMVLGFMVS